MMIRLAACFSVLSMLGYAYAGQDSQASLDRFRNGFSREVSETLRSNQPDSLSVDSSTCLSKAQKRQLDAFDRILRCDAFRKADCLRTYHAFRREPHPGLFTSMYIMAFSARGLTKVTGVLRKQKRPFFPIESREYYKWHVVEGNLVLLVQEGAPQHDLFNRLDTLAMKYAQPSGARHE